MNKLLQYKIHEAASYFNGNEPTGNELYLLNLLLDLGKEYNNLVEEYNALRVSRKRKNTTMQQGRCVPY